MSRYYQRSSIVLVTVVLLLLGACQSAPFPTTLKQIEQAPPRQVTLDIRHWHTEQGTRVLFVPAPTLPMVDVRLTFAAGSARDGDLPGLAAMTSHLIDAGAGSLTVDDIARGFADLGARLSTSSHRDMGIVELRSLTDPEYLAPAVDLFLQVLAAPTFPQDALERRRQQALVGLARAKQVPGPQVRERYDATVFAGHPYGHRSGGTEVSLSAIRRADLRAFYQRYYAAGNGNIAIVGDLSEAEARILAARISKALPAGNKAEPLMQVARPQAAQREHIDFDASQTHILIGQQSIHRGHPDWVPLYVGNEILGGGGFASILMEEVRQKRGFVYGISSNFAPMEAAGAFTIQLQTATDNADEALQLTLSLLRDFIDQGPGEEQLRAAIDSITGSTALGIAENRQIVGHLGATAFYDMPLDYLQWFDQQVRQMTVDTIRDAFRRNLDPDTLAIVSIGRAAPADADKPDQAAAPVVP